MSTHSVPPVSTQLVLPGTMTLQHTFNHIDCPACETTKEDTLGHDPDSLLKLKFSSAAAKWLSTRNHILKERSFYMAGHHINQLNKFLGEIPIGKMHVGHLRQYQLARIANLITLPDGTESQPWKRLAGSPTINHDSGDSLQEFKGAGVAE